MNYEQLYDTLTEREKAVAESLKAAGRLSRAIGKNTESGNLAEVKKIAQLLEETTDQLRGQVAEIRAEAEGFDVKAYFTGGDFTRQLLEACRAANIDVTGEKGTYEMFPYKVRVVGDGERSEEVWMDRKKIPSARPSAAPGPTKAGQEKL
ncbi:MAG: hypothetical protein K6E83_08485, partial [Clostridium sp.]|nr:hypothetical protein [Clostridium sp.]